MRDDSSHLTLIINVESGRQGFQPRFEHHSRVMPRLGPHPPTIAANTHASGMAAAETSNSVDGPSARIISVHDLSLAQNNDVAAALDDESEGNGSIVSARDGGNNSPDAPLVPGLSGVAASAGGDAEQCAEWGACNSFYNL